MSGWADTPGTGKALYDFPGGQKQQLALKAGDEVVVEQCKQAWYRGYLVSDPSKRGIFPMTYVQFTPAPESAPTASPDAVIAPSTTTSSPNAPVTNTDASSTVSTSSSTSSSGGTTELPAGASTQLETTKTTVSTPTATTTPTSEQVEEKAVTLSFANLVNTTSTSTTTSASSTAEGEGKVPVSDAPPAIMIDTRGAISDGFIVVNGADSEPATATNTDLVTLLHRHTKADPSSPSVSSSPKMALPDPLSRHSGSNDKLRSMLNVFQHLDAEEITGPVTSSSSTRYHLFLDVKVCIFSVGEATELFFSLYSQNQGAFISEDYVVKLPPPGMPEHTKILGKMKTVFKDLEAKDLEGDLWLVCRIYRRGMLIYDSKEVAAKAGKPQSGPTTRRGFGCAATCLTGARLLDNIGKPYEPPPASLCIYTPKEEKEFIFHRIHEIIMSGGRDKEKEIEPAAKAKGIALALTLYEGNLADARAKVRDLREVCETLRLGFPAPPLPSDTRNHMYIVLHDGSFNQGKKTAPMNVEVRVKVVRSNYTEVKQCISSGSGDAEMSQFDSQVYYHTNTPNFNETLRLRLAPDVFEDSHLFFEFWHISTNPKKSAAFAHAYFPLCYDRGTVVPSQIHTLSTFNPFGSSDKYLTDANVRQPRKEFFRFQTSLVSTQMTQNASYATISKWRNCPLPSLKEVLLGLFSKSSAANDILAMFPYTRELLNHLISITASPAHEDCRNDALAALFLVLTRLGREHKHLIDAYVTSLFNDPTAHHRLLAYVAHSLQDNLDALVTTLINSSASSPSSSPSANPLSPTNPSATSPPSSSSSSPSPSSSASTTPSLLAFTNNADLTNIQVRTRTLSTALFSIPSTPITSKLAGTSSSASPTSPSSPASSSSTSSSSSAPATPLRARSVPAGCLRDDDPHSLIRVARPICSIIQLAVQSFLLDSRTGPSASLSMDMFRDRLKGILTLINAYLQVEPGDVERLKYVLPTQVVFARQIPGILSVYRAVFSDDEIADLAASTIVAMHASPSISVERLDLIRSFIDPTSIDTAPLSSEHPTINAFSPKQARRCAAAIFSGVATHIRLGIRQRTLNELCLSTAILQSYVPRIYASKRGLGGMSAADSSSGSSEYDLSDTFPVVHALIEAIHARRLATILDAKALNSSPTLSSSSSSSPPPPSLLLPSASSLQALISVSSTVGLTNPSTPTTLALPTTSATLASSLVLGPSQGSPWLGSTAPSSTETKTEYTPHLVPPSEKVKLSCNVDLDVDPMAALLGLLSLYDDTTLGAFFLSVPLDSRTTSATRLLHLLHTSLLQPIVPSPWVEVRLLHLKIVMDMLARLSVHMRDVTILGQHLSSNGGVMTTPLSPDAPNVPLSATQTTLTGFDPALWVAWFQVALEVRLNTLLRPDKQSPQLIQRTTPIVGNARAVAITLTMTMWKAISPAQKVRTSSLLVPELFHVLSDQDVPSEMQVTALSVYFDMLKAQFEVEKDFSEVERHSIDALYEIANINIERGASCMQLICSTVRSKLDANPNEPMNTACREFLDHMQTLYDMMVSLLKLPDSLEYEDDRALVALGLIRYIEGTGHRAATRKAMHTRYMQFLVDLHTKSKNYVEVGIAQMQQAKMLEWTETQLDASGPHPAEPERCRKARLMELAVESFCLAEDWERAIDRSDYLRQYYQFMVFDYVKLTTLLTNQARYFSNIISGSRFYSNYYRVCFFGKFESSLTQQQEFVYKGARLEQIMEFNHRLKRRYPEAHFIMSSEAPSSELLSKHDQVITIVHVKPTSLDRRPDILAKIEEKGEAVSSHPTANLLSRRSSEAVAMDAPFFAVVPKPLVPKPNVVVHHADNDSVNVFEYARPWRRKGPDGSFNEISDSWLVKTFIVTEETFPSNRRRIPISHRLEVILTPIEVAIDTIATKTKEIEANVTKVRAAAQSMGGDAARGNVDVGPLSMNLNGVIDAAVNGGISKYLQAFFVPSFTDAASLHVEEEKANIVASLDKRRIHQDTLRHEMLRQSKVLTEGLECFGNVCSENLRGLYNHLKTNLQKMTTTLQELQQ